MRKLLNFNLNGEITVKIPETIREKKSIFLNEIRRSTVSGILWKFSNIIPRKNWVGIPRKNPR